MSTTHKAVAEKTAQFAADIKVLYLDPQHEAMLIIATLAYYAQTTPPPFASGSVKFDKPKLTGKALFEAHKDVFESLDKLRK
jgi:hypothetical protein